MPAINVYHQVLDKHFVAKIVGQPISEFLIRKGNTLDNSAVASILSLDVRTSSGEILNLIFKSMNPIAPNFVPAVSSQSTSISSAEAKFRSATEMYSIEIQFYQKIAPAIEQITQEPLPIPKLYCADNDESAAFIVLQDLRPLGYKSGKKFKGLTLPEVKSVLQALGKFHAQSFTLLQNQGDKLFNDDTSRVFTEKHPTTSRKGVNMMGFIENVYQEVQEVLRKHRGDALADKMTKFNGKAQATIVRPWKQTDDKYFPVMIFGDLWVNNILFLYEDDNSKSVKDVKFIDFQNCRRGNIYEDLLYFLLCSTTPEFRAQNLSHCFEIYFQAFASTIETLKVPLPEGFSLDVLKRDYNENLDSGFCYMAFAIPFQLGIHIPPPSPATPVPGKEKENFFGNFDTPTKSITVDDLLAGLCSSLKLSMDNSQRAINRLESVVKEMVELGVL